MSMLGRSPALSRGIASLPQNSASPLNRLGDPAALMFSLLWNFDMATSGPGGRYAWTNGPGSVHCLFLVIFFAACMLLLAQCLVLTLWPGTGVAIAPPGPCVSSCSGESGSYSQGDDKVFAHF